jgi:hypothetical protein
MRTTVTLDPDVETLLRQRMHERGESMKHVLNEALRVALAEDGRAERERVRFPTYSLEDEETIRKLQLQQ